MRLALAALLVVTLAGCASNETHANLADAARINTQLGVDYLRQGKTALAQEKLERALAEDPEYAPAHEAIAILYQQQGDARAAEKQFRKALSLQGDNPQLRNNFGVFLCRTGKPRDADRYFMDAAADKHYTTPDVAWTNAGMCAKSYDLAKAEADFREALRINPNATDALAQMAWLSYTNKDYLHARAFMERFEAVGKPTSETLWIASRTERALGDEMMARKYEARLKRDFPDSAEAASLAPASHQ